MKRTAIAKNTRDDAMTLAEILGVPDLSERAAVMMAEAMVPTKEAHVARRASKARQMEGTRAAEEARGTSEDKMLALAFARDRNGIRRYSSRVAAAEALAQDANTYMAARGLKPVSVRTWRRYVPESFLP